jgi:hypothetical protein
MVPSLWRVLWYRVGTPLFLLALSLWAAGVFESVWTLNDNNLGSIGFHCC